LKVGILGVGAIPVALLMEVTQALVHDLPDVSSVVVGDVLAVPQNAFDRRRNQYISSMILSDVRSYAGRKTGLDRVLGLVDVDVYAYGLNYVFGEAYSPGEAGLVSIWRLRPQFYGEATDDKALMERTIKEAVHELGHTLGLQHCLKNRCVMHFSNSIFDTDKKQRFFCDQCYLMASIAIDKIGQTA